MQPEKIIDVQDLAVSFGGNDVLKGVTFSAFKGEVTVIIGGSGSGKTTILKHLIGLYPVQEGTVQVLGQNMARLEEAATTGFYLQMGVFYQNGALLNSMTVAENVALPLEQHTRLSSEMIEQIVRLKLSLVDLEEAFHLFPSQLSGGMLKRAGIARAIVMDPPLLFCDEPGAGLDPVSLSALDQLILNLKEQLGITIILVTHIVPSILRLADRVVYLEQGRVVYEGSVDGAVDHDNARLKDFFKKGTGG
jgi:phospholipid/cholesterol/gamma-HCH transport system ATP-binding protein